MSLLFETICVKNGKLQNLSYHNQRLNQSRSIALNSTDHIDLRDYIYISGYYKTGLVKCRVSYDHKIRSISYEHYHPRIIRSIKTIVDNDISYPLKYENRQRLNTHYKNRQGHDEVLIVKNGLLTDSTYYNVALYNGKDWLTPKSPLLHGTARARLLKKGILKEADIKLKELQSFQKVCLFNALNDFGEVELGISEVY